jgi:hypothetical protein
LNEDLGRRIKSESKKIIISVFLKQNLVANKEIKVQFENLTRAKRIPLLFKRSKTIKKCKMEKNYPKNKAFGGFKRYYKSKK